MPTLSTARPQAGSEAAPRLSPAYVSAWLFRPVSAAPLVSFRVLFGLLTLFSSLRFLALGWVEAQYGSSALKFSYSGFEWVEYPGQTGLYLLYGLMILASLGIILGALYRLSAVVFFLAFSYVELIDKTYYLNHYYFVSLVAFWMIWVPAHRSHSLDAGWWPRLRGATVPRWSVLLFQFQLAVVYTYAGLAKITPHWLLEALPLRLWLPAQDHTPLIGPLLHQDWVAYVFSWAGMLFDCTIILWLCLRRTRPWAYLAVLGFHALTGYWFQIGVFPLVMSALVLVFFSPAWHARVQAGLARLLGSAPHPGAAPAPPAPSLGWLRPATLLVLGLYVGFQLLYPWRYLLYGGNRFWHERGYRFGWRVMLMEKAGTATFYVQDGPQGRRGAVRNEDFLNDHQVKQMSFQPDMILQYAHWLAAHYQQQGMQRPQVRAEVYVTLNGQPSQLLVDPAVDLAQVSDEQTHWILPHAER